MARRRNAILAHRHAANGGNLRAHLGGRQHAAVAGLGALAQFDLDHLDLRVGGGGRKFLGVEMARCVAAAEIAGAELPDDVAAPLAMVGAVAALARVMGETAKLGAAVERADRVGAERTETHRRNVEHRGRIGLAAIRTADR